ncbi:MAG: NAD(P)-binding protein, partial [Streptosporangiaceae bacterium]
MWRSCARCTRASGRPTSGTGRPARRWGSAVSRDQVAVVGAGVAGLAAAEELGRQRDVVVLDRLPVPGGVLSYDHPGVTT